MGILFGFLGRLVVIFTCITSMITTTKIVGFVDTYSDEIGAVVKEANNYDTIEEFINSLSDMEEDFDFSDVEEAISEDEIIDDSADEEAKKAEEQLKKEEAEKAAKEAEEKLKKEEAEKAAQEAAEKEAAEKEEEEKAAAEAAEKEAAEKAAAEAAAALEQAVTAEPAATAPAAPSGKTEISRVYMEDCGMDTGYWVVTYSDGTVEYIDE